MVKKTERLNIPISSEQKIKLEAIADKQEVSVSELVRKVLRKYISEYEKKEQG